MERELEGLTDRAREMPIFGVLFPNFLSRLVGKAHNLFFCSGFGFASWLFVRLPLLLLESQSSLLSFTIAYKESAHSFSVCFHVRIHSA